MAFKILLDNNFLDQPKIDDLEFTIERGSVSDDDYFEGLISSFELSEVEFFGDSFTYIKNRWDNENACGQIDVTITATCCENQVYYGLIELAECGIKECSVLCKIVDNGYGAAIKNGRDLSINLGGKSSRNGEDIGIEPQKYIITNGFLKTGGTANFIYTTKEVYGYELDESLQHILNYLTDGKIQLVSDKLTNGTRYMLTTGHNLYYGTNGKSPTVTINCLLTTLKKLLCYNWSLNNSIMKVEDVNFFYNSDPHKSIPCPKDYVTTLCEDLLYSSVKVGDSEGLTGYGDGGPTSYYYDTEEGVDVIVQNNFSSLPDGDLTSHIATTFNSTGTCGVDKTLDLTSDCIRHSSNLIQFLTFSQFPENEISNVKDYFDDVFIVEIQAASQSDEVGFTTYLEPQSPNITLSSTKFFNNPSLTNEKILERWDGFLPQTLNAGLKCDTLGCVASRDSDLVIITSSVLNANDLHDLNFNVADQNYNTDPVTGFDVTKQIFTAKKSGVYSVEANYCIDISGNSPDERYQIVIMLIRNDLSTYLIYSTSHLSPGFIGCDCFTYNFPDIYLNEGEKIKPYVRFYDSSPTTHTVTVCDGSNIVITTECQDTFTSSEQNLNTCSTFESLESICSINDLIANSDKTLILKRGAEFIKKAVINAKTGLTQWSGMRRI